MKLLPLTNLGRQLRPKYQLPIYGLVFAFTFSSMGLSIWFASWLARLLGIHTDMPVGAQRYGDLWTVLILLFFVAAALIFYLLSFVCMAMVLRWLYGWTSEQVRKLMFESRILAHWLKGNENT